MSLDLPPEAAALRDRAVSPLLALLEQRGIADRLTAIEVEHARSLHPSSFDEYAQIGEDMDAIEAGEDMDATKTIDELSPGEWVKVAGEWCEVMVIRPQILTVRREHSACEWEYHAADGEAFAWHPAGF